MIFNIVSAKPASCESDKDCLKGKAKCVRRECQCKDTNGYGDGKAKCDSKYEIFVLSPCSCIEKETDLFCLIC